VAALGAAAASIALGASAQAAKDDTTLVSANNSGEAATAAAVNSSVSTDGRFIAFQSDADNLSAVANDGVTNVFVRDRQTNTTILVSRTSGASGDPADGSSTDPSISEDGRLVAFASEANNLSGEDGTESDVFVRDLVANTTTLVSRTTGAAGLGGLDDSDQPSISPDGGFVAFRSEANNLSEEDLDSVTNIFVRDLAANETTLISRTTGDGDDGPGDGAAANGNSSNPSAALFGTRVAFESVADNLNASPDDNAFTNVFVRQVDLETTTSAAVRDSGLLADASSTDPSLEAFARFVAFRTAANLEPAADTNGVSDIYVHDLQADTTRLVSRASGVDGPDADAASDNPSISVGGRYVAFDSAADNLSDADENTVTNVFVRDRQDGTTALVSRVSGAGGAGANGSSVNPAIGADGRFVGFESLATNLTATATNGVAQVFARDVLGPGVPDPFGDNTPPRLRLDFDRKQKLGKAIKVRVSCDEPCSIVAKGKVKAQGKGKTNGPKSGKLKRATTALDAGDSQRLKLRLTKKAKRALEGDERGKAKVKVTARDGAANKRTKRANIKLR
jgi:Tol biopolymer transport system component